MRNSNPISLLLVLFDSKQFGLSENPIFSSNGSVVFDVWPPKVVKRAKIEFF